MNKQDFLNALEILIAKIPITEQKKTIVYYDEIISDYMEDGLSEQEAVVKLGDINIIANGIINDYVTDENASNNQNTNESWTSGTKIISAVLLFISAPLWIALLLAVVIITLVVPSILVFVIFLLVFVFLLIGCIGIIGAPFVASTVSIAMAVAQFGAGLACLGIFGLMLILLKHICKWIKTLLTVIRKKIFKTKGEEKSESFENL